jgi:phosphopantetheinyl transferase
MDTKAARQLIARDIADAVRLRRCLKQVGIDLEIAIGLRDWNSVRQAFNAIREALQQDI